MLGGAGFKSQTGQSEEVDMVAMWICVLVLLWVSR